MTAVIINTDRSKWAIGILSVVLIAFNITRIYCVPLTHDEATTMMQYVPGCLNDIVTNKWPTANNHLLNTLLTKLFTGIFGSSLLFVRMASLLAQVVFLVFSYKILSRLIEKPLWVLAAFAVLNFNPFLFEFWGLCRGYALSLGFMMASIYYLLVYLRTASVKALWACFLIAVLCVYANFALLYFYIALCIVVALLVFKQRRFRDLVSLFVSAAVLAAMIAYPIVQLKKANQFYYGGDQGFVQDTIGTLVRETFFLDGVHGCLLIVAWLITLLVLAMGTYWAVKWIKGRDRNINTGMVLWLLLVLPAAATVLQHLLLGNKFLIERTALFFIPLFILSFVSWLHDLRDSMPAVSRVLLLFAVLLSAGNFARHATWATTRSWNYDRYNELVLKRMIKRKQGSAPLKVRVYWQFAPSFQYYTVHKYPGQFYPVAFIQSPVDGDTSYDYYYIHQDDLPYIPTGYTVDTSFFDGKYILLKK